MAVKIFNDKRGISEDAGFWIFRIILIMVVVFAAVFFVNSIIKTNLDTEGLELDLILARIINSPDCLAYQDSDTNRIYPGYVNLNFYSQSYLEKNCVKLNSGDLVGIRIELDSKEPIYLNKDYYDDTEPLTFSSKYYKVQKSYPVIVINNYERTDSILRVILVSQKR